MLTVVACPECEVPAEITDRFSLSSTDGPVDCVALSCVGGHHFRMPSELLSAGSREQLEPPARGWTARPHLDHDGDRAARTHAARRRGA